MIRGGEYGVSKINDWESFFCDGTMGGSLGTSGSASPVMRGSGERRLGQEICCVRSRDFERKYLLTEKRFEESGVSAGVEEREVLGDFVSVRFVSVPPAIVSWEMACQSYDYDFLKWR